MVEPGECPTHVEGNWNLHVKYADSRTGQMGSGAIEDATADYNAGDLPLEDLRIVVESARAGCMLSDAVDVLNVDASSDAPGLFTGAAVVPIPGSAPVNVEVEMTAAGVREQVTLVGSGTLTARATFEVESGGDYEVCAEVVGVSPA